MRLYILMNQRTPEQLTIDFNQFYEDSKIFMKILCKVKTETQKNEAQNEFQQLKDKFNIMNDEYKNIAFKNKKKYIYDDAEDKPYCKMIISQRNAEPRIGLLNHKLKNIKLNKEINNELEDYLKVGKIFSKFEGFVNGTYYLITKRTKCYITIKELNYVQIKMKDGSTNTRLLKLSNHLEKKYHINKMNIYNFFDADKKEYSFDDDFKIKLCGWSKYEWEKKV